MTIDSSPIKISDLIGFCFSAMALIVSAVSLCYVYIQIRASTRQKHLDFHIKLIDINRELLKMGFQDPEIFRLLRGEEIADKDKQNRFIQMCMNQSLVMWMGKDRGIIDDESWYSLKKDIATFINLPPVYNHWLEVSPYYIPAFCVFINDLVRRK